MSGAVALGRLERWVRSVVYPGARLVLWLLFYLSILLGGWVLIGMTLGGWTPVVITSGSMEPAVSVGDVLLIETSPGNSVSQRSIVVFERVDGTSVAHRVFSVEGNELVTKGDANPSPDTERVVSTEIKGVARVLVPLVGLPAVWRDQGNVVALAAWATLSLGGAVHFVLTLLPGLRKRRERDVDRGDASHVGMRRVRMLVAVLVTAQFVLDPSRFELLGESSGQTPLFLGLMSVLLLTNFVSARVSTESSRRRMPVVELMIDTALVVFLSALTGSAGLGWVLFALPIIEAAVRFGLVGALNHWMILTTLTIAARVWTYELAGTNDLLEELERTLDQMSVLFLVVVPGAYLAEQLLGDVSEQRRALGRVVARSDLLERVAESGRRINQLDGQHVSAVIEGTHRLGFDVVDLVVSNGDGWRKVGGGPEWDIPVPGTEASGLRPDDLEHAAVMASGDDAAEQAALDAADLGVVLTHSVVATSSVRAVLRAGVRAGRGLTTGEIDAFRLLAGQASVALQNHELLVEISSMQDELERQAHHDALTGLPNRVRMLDELDRSSSDDERPAVMFLDLDGFKPVNDRLGHDAGDELLRQVAERLVAAAPRESLVARVGGDEFTILVRGALADARAQAIADAVSDEIRRPFEVNDDKVRIGTSIGIAFGDGSLPGSELIRRADVAMYVAKGKGRDVPHELYRPEFDHAEDRRAALSEDITEAIESGQVRVVFQPIVRFSTDAERQRLRIAGVEALVRWEHPSFGPVPAPEIVDAAKSAGAGSQLHRHIADDAMRAVAGWLPMLGDRTFFVSINASPDDLASDHLVPNLTDAVRRSGLDPHTVFVEISEQLVSPNLPTVMENIHELNRHGIRMLLDDFGEGQTSLSYIHELPVAGIKLDRRLVVNAQRSQTDRIVIESVVDLCGRLELLVIAEGIESRTHLDVIGGVGCTLAQGYYLGRPAGGDEVIEMILAWQTSDGVTV